jgi:hypothetical protein
VQIVRQAAAATLSNVEEHVICGIGECFGSSGGASAAGSPGST